MERIYDDHKYKPIRIVRTYTYKFQIPDGTSYCLAKTEHSTLCLVSFWNADDESTCVAKIFEHRHQGIHEFNIGSKLSNENVLTPLAIYDSRDMCVIFYPYCLGGTIENLIAGPMLSERKCKLLFKQMVLGLHYLHRKKVLHNDVKPENFFIDDRTIKIGDYGLARLLNGKELDKEFVGTPLYMAPEVLARSPHSFSADIWSLGVSLFYMYCKVLPYNGNNVAELIATMYSRIIRFTRESSDELIDLVRNMLKLCPSERISIEEILEHDWLDPLPKSARTEPERIRGRGYTKRLCQSAPPCLERSHSNNPVDNT